jgi:hypothetical protein
MIELLKLIDISIPPLKRVQKAVGEKFHLTKEKNVVTVKFENWMTYTIKDFSDDDNRSLVPGFYNHALEYKKLTKEVHSLMNEVRKEVTDEKYSMQVMANLFEKMTDAIAVFINIALNCIEDFDTFDDDMTGRFTSMRNDSGEVISLEKMDLSQRASNLLETYDFAFKAFQIFEYSFLIGGKEWAKKAIEIIESEADINPNVNEILEKLNDPNVEVKIFAVNNKGQKIEVSKHEFEELLSSMNNDNDDPYDLRNMPTIGEA